MDVDNRKEFQFDTHSSWMLYLFLSILAIGLLGGVLEIFRKGFNHLEPINYVSTLYFMLLPFLFKKNSSQKVILMEESLIIKKFFKKKIHKWTNLKVVELKEEIYTYFINIKTRSENVILIQSESGNSKIRSGYISNYDTLKKELEIKLDKKILRKDVKLNWFLKWFDHVY